MNEGFPCGKNTASKGETGVAGWCAFFSPIALASDLLFSVSPPRPPSQHPPMATRARMALISVVSLTGAGIWFVHDAQVQERAALHAGVLRDAELLRAKTAERGGEGPPRVA